MKNFTKLLMAVVLLAASACVQDNTEDLAPVLPEQGGSGEVATLRVTLPAPDTKTALGDKTADGKYPVYWSEGDCLAVNGKTTTSLKIDESNPAVAVFELPLGITIPYNIIYPYQGDDVVVNSKNGRYPVLFATEQEYTEGTFSQGSAPMYAYSDGFSDVEMHHLATALRFRVNANVADDVTLKYVSVSTVEAEPISGVFDLDCQTGKLYSRSGSISTVFYTFPGETFKLTAEESVFYITVPYGEYTEFEVNFVATDGRVCTKTFSGKGEQAIGAGKVREFPLVTFSEDSKMHLIGTDQDMMDFARSVKEGTFTGSDGALLVSDIDMSNQEWTPIENYQGLFEGRNHTIKGLTKPLFGDQAKATISNVIVEANLVEESETVVGIITRTLASGGRIFNSFAKGSITYKNSAVATTGQYTDLNIGGLVGRVEGGEIEKARSEVAIVIEAATPKSSSAYYPCVGGIVGYATNATIKGTTNYSSITWRDAAAASSTGMKTFIGGTIGYLPAGCTFSDNINEGTLTVKSSVNQLHLGGIAGASRAEMDNCLNAGDIVADATFDRGLIGGVVGVFNDGQTAGLTLENAQNTGSLNIGSSYYITNRSGIGGVAGYVYPKSNIAGCKNAGPITFAGSSKCGGPNAELTGDGNANIAIGGVVGLDYSTKISNCVNEKSGKIDVGGSIASLDWLKHAGRQSSVGGVSGTRPEANYVAENASMTSCENHAEINLHFAQLGKAEVFMGGVVGYYVIYNMNDCHNYGDIICSVDYSDETKTAIKAANLSGVVGFAAFQKESIKTSMTNCTNHGKIEYTSATANTINIAGVARFTDYKHTVAIENCVNHGNVVVNDDAEAENIYVGGVLSRLDNTISQYLTMKNCKNEGDIDCEASINGKVCIGGVFAYSAAPAWSASQASGLSNGGYVNFSGTANEVCIGGYAGESTGVHEVPFVAEAEVTCTGTVARDAYIGGYIGKMHNIEVGGTFDVTTTANGKVSFNGVAENVYLAGGIGAVTSARPVTLKGITNKGAVVFEDNISKNFHPENAYVAGVVGYINLAGNVANRSVSVLKSSNNEGAISYYGKTTDGAYIGGVAGHAPNTSLSGCANAESGKIISKGIAGGIDKMYDGGTVIVTHDMAVGGVAGESGYDVLNCSNNAAIDYTCVVNAEIDANVTSRFDIGGVVGRVYSAPTEEQRDINLTGNSNSGKITINGTPGNVVFPWAGTGRDSSTGAWAYDTINNIARVDYRVTRRNNAGGIFGRVFENNTLAPTTLDINSNFKHENNRNTGDIIAPNVGQVRVLQLGGILADNLTLYTTFTGCTNSGNIRVAGANANDAQQFGYFVYMGGIVARHFHTISTAYASGDKITNPTLTFMNCENSGSISLDEGPNGIRNTVAGGIIAEIMCGTSDFKSGTYAYRRYYNVKIQNCKNLEGGDISYYSTCQHTHYTCTYAGGIMGKGGFGHQNATSYYSAFNLQIEDCENHASIQYDRNDRKSAWYNHPELCGVGGILGHYIGAVVESNKLSGVSPWEAVLTSCRNYGRVWGMTGYFGGIIGYARHNVIVTGTPEKPTENHGDIVVERDADGKVVLMGKYGNRAMYVGGIMGCTYEYNYGSTATTEYAREIRINNAINYGAVGSTSYAGGIGGLYYSAAHFVEDCTNVGEIYSLEGNSTTIGSIVGSPRTTAMTLDGVAYSARQIGLRNCKVGGKVLRGAAEAVEVTADNYFDYIYGQRWTAHQAETVVEGVPYDGCTFYAVGGGSEGESGN